MDTSLLLVILLTVHVFGAVFGFGPSVAYAILGPAAGKASPQGGLAIMEAMIAIEKRLILPWAIAIQPLSGLALIFLAGYNVNFFSHYWLWIGILLYAAAFYLAILVQTPLLEKMVHIVKAGPPTPELMAAAKRTQQLGPVITILLALIVILMVAKPGA
jgi:uncharacterized membrane protein